MKKITLLFAAIALACAAQAQTYKVLQIHKGTEITHEVKLSDIDSISFKVVDPFSGHAYVDLGLPSGTLWATCNIGAAYPEDHGDYFAWGETTPKKKADGSYDSYTLQNYKWCTSDTIIEVDADGLETVTYDNKYTKYCTDEKYGTVDNLEILELADDAAYINWGGAWRMPTRKEFSELLNNCTWTWTRRGGTNGYKVTSNAEGNTNYIFIPAAGNRDDSNFSAKGSDCNYWSSSGSSNCARGLFCIYDDHQQIRSCYFRYLGLPIRPVCSKQ